MWHNPVASSEESEKPQVEAVKYVRDVAQPGSVHAWGAWGRKFKSCRPDEQRRLTSNCGPLLLLYFSK
jgi:hypothetical protein